MTIKEMISQLELAAKQVGNDKEVACVLVGWGENDYSIPSYIVVGDFTDQDGAEIKCAFVSGVGGSEFTRRGVPHYEWKPYEDKLVEKDQAK